MRGPTVTQGLWNSEFVQVIALPAQTTSDPAWPEGHRLGARSGP